MQKKDSNPKLKALMQLRELVDQLINDDFQSDKMPKLMALKVTKVEKPELMEETREEELEAPGLPMKEDCGEDSEAVLKLKKLLRK